MLSSSYSMYLVFTSLCACLSPTAVAPTSTVVLSCGPSAPQRIPKNAWRHFWLSLLGADKSIQWVEARKLLQIVLRSRNLTLRQATGPSRDCLLLASALCSTLLPGTQWALKHATDGYMPAWKFISVWIFKPSFSRWHSLKSFLFFLLLPQRCRKRQFMYLLLTSKL